MSKKLQHINRRLTDDERKLAAEIREGAKNEFPSKHVAEIPPPPGIPQRMHAARQTRGITRYELGQLADVPSTVVRDIEQGHDVPLSQLQSVANVLGLTIELVEQAQQT